MKKKVLSVGQCALDHSNISDLLNRLFAVDVVRANSHQVAMDAVRGDKFDLILVNRILDATGTPGLDVIRSLKDESSTDPIPVMLISNYEEAQQEAVAAGAVTGFGKSALQEPETAERLGQYLG